MLPKLVIDEKTDQLCLFINPFREKSFKNEDLSVIDTRPILTLNSQNSGQGKIGSFEDSQMAACSILSPSEKKVRVATEWRGARALCKHFFLQQKLLGVMQFFVVPLFQNHFFLQQKYVVDGLSAKQIAMEIFFSKMAVLDALKQFGIPVREAHYHHGHPSQPRFGKKFRKHHLVHDKVEQRVILVARELYEQEFSLRQIARVLNHMRIATKCNGKAWHPEMIRRILEGNCNTDS